MAERDVEITKTVAEMAGFCQKFLELTNMEKVGFMLLQSQINSLEVKQARLLQENETIEKKNTAAKDTASKIVGVANEEANRIMAIVNDKNFGTIKLLKETQEYLNGVKQFCTNVEMRLLKEKEQVGAGLEKKVVALNK